MANYTVCFDFDGVLHSYQTGWKGDTVVADPPVPGMAEAMVFLQGMGFKFTVCSTRAVTPQGAQAIRDWMRLHDFPDCPVTGTKPPAHLYVDDRAIPFSGDAAAMVEAICRWPGTWNKGPEWADLLVRDKRLVIPQAGPSPVQVMREAWEDSTRSRSLLQQLLEHAEGAPTELLMEIRSHLAVARVQGVATRVKRLNEAHGEAQ